MVGKYRAYEKRRMGKGLPCPSFGGDVVWRGGVVDVLDRCGDGHAALCPSYVVKELQPHVPDAWIDASKKDDKDQETGIVGYEIPFNRHFYQYQPPQDLAEIDADLDKVSAEIMALLQAVHS